MTFDPSKPVPEEFEARLTALLLGELPPDEAAALREAIGNIPSWRISTRA